MKSRVVAASIAALVVVGAACDPAAPPPPPPADPGAVVFPPKGEVPEGLEALGEFNITCYAGKGKTASGEPTSMDVVAADTDLLPMRSRIYIDGVGWRTVLDRGSAIKGLKLDIWLPTKDDCRKWGRQFRNVYREAPAETVAGS